MVVAYKRSVYKRSVRSAGPNPPHTATGGASAHEPTSPRVRVPGPDSPTQSHGHMGPSPSLANRSAYPDSIIAEGDQGSKSQRGRPTTHQLLAARPSPRGERKGPGRTHGERLPRLRLELSGVRQARSTCFHEINKVHIVKTALRRPRP